MQLYNLQFEALTIELQNKKKKNECSLTLTNDKVFLYFSLLLVIKQLSVFRKTKSIDSG